MAEISLKQVNILMECGADFTMGIVIRDDSNSLVDLTGYTVTAQLREYAEAQDYFEFTATHNNAGGRITISMPHEDTAQISYTSGVYDVFIIDTNNISEKVVKGEVTVDPNVTKPIAGTIMYLVSFASEDDFPTTGEMRRLYFSHASRKMYRWNGTNYIGIITDGEAATVEVGTVTTLDAGEDATVENVGSLTNAVFDFGIPKGDPGTTSWEGITDKPSEYPPESHTHDDRYYTETEVDTALSGKSDTSHTHDDRYYTESETNTLLSAKADSYDVATALSAKADSSSVYTKTQTDTLLNEKEDTANLGDLAYEDTVNYDTEVTNKPTLGALSELNTLNYTSELLTNKPTLGSMAQKNDANSDNKYYVRRNDAWVDADGRYYTESEVDTMLALKADESSLGTLASQDDTGVDGKQYVRKDGAWENLADTLSEKADIIHTSASGSLVHITDGAAYPVDSLNVSIDPVQDLHGYDAPWPAGGGKNKWISGQYTKTFTDVTYTPDGDAIKINGTLTATRNYYFSYDGVNISYGYKLPAGTYTYSNTLLSGTASSVIGGYGLSIWYDSDPETRVVEQIGIGGSSKTFTLAGDATIQPFLYFTSGSSFTNAVYGFQLESGSTKTDWTPYSNVCPISGHSSATVTRTGKNLLALSADDMGKNWDGSANVKRCWKSFKLPKGKYTFSGDGSAIGTYFTQTVVGRSKFPWPYTQTQWDNGSQYFQNSQLYQNGDYQARTYEVTDEYPYLHLGFISQSDNITVSDFTNAQIQLEVGESATAYESPHVQTVTIALGDTYYGAQLDAVAGTLTVTHAIVDLGTLSWQYLAEYHRFFTTISDMQSTPVDVVTSAICSSYPSNTWNYVGPDNVNRDYIFACGNQYITIRDTRYTETSEFTTAMDGVQLVYELTTPTVITGLTPAQIQALQGLNNVWADTGDVAVGYRADTKRYIDGALSKAVAELQALILENS